MYPQPKELMTIYDKTVPKVCEKRIQCLRIRLSNTSQHILDVLAEMEAYYRVAHHEGGSSSNSSAAGVE